jgi:hypothetical protein
MQPPGGYGQPPPPYGAPPPGYGSVPPQTGYGAPMAPPYGAAPQAYGAPAGASSVMGIPLEPGERVLWFKRHDYTTEMVLNIIIGVVLLIVLVGIVFIVLGATVNGRKPRAHILTNRRIIYVTGGGQVMQFYLNQIANIEAVREQRSSGGGGLIGAAVAAAANAAMNHFADQNHKMDPSYWRRTNAINLIFGNNTRARIPAEMGYGADLGLLTTRAVFNREADTLPSAMHYLP